MSSAPHRGERSQLHRGVSGDLQTWDWTKGQIEQLGVPVPTGDGTTEEVTVRLKTPINGPAHKFLRLRVDQSP